MNNKDEYNPFQVTGYVSPELFCDRIEDCKRINSAIDNQRNITLFAHRKLGKTGLIKHVFNQLQSEKEVKIFYIDVMPARSMAEFTKLLASSILGKLEKKPVLFLKKAGKLLSAMRPQIAFDSYSGEPSITLDIETEEQAKVGLDHIFDYIRGFADQYKIVIALDEFQQVCEFPEKNIEAILRAQIQQLPQVVFIFSGSSKHLLSTMFTDKKRPFYHSTEMMELDYIPKNIYADFIIEKFAKGKRKIEQEEVYRILDWCRLHTYYVQYVCNRLYATAEKNITKNSVTEMFHKVLIEQESVFYSYRKLLTQPQWTLLKAIACEEGIKSVTGKDFIQKYKLGLPSSTMVTLKALLEKELLLEENEKYYVYDVFMARWFQNIHIA